MVENDIDQLEFIALTQTKIPSLSTPTLITENTIELISDPVTSKGNSIFGYNTFLIQYFI